MDSSAKTALAALMVSLSASLLVWVSFGTMLAGRLVATLSYSSVEGILSGGLTLALENIIRQSVQMHAALHQAYIDYPIESSLPA